MGNQKNADRITSVYYQGGTLVLKDPDPTLTPPAPFQWIKSHWRCEGYHYGALTDWFRQQAIRDTVPRWQPLDLILRDTRQPHAYQDAALAAWEAAGRRGSIVLPTGAGKNLRRHPRHPPRQPLGGGRRADH